MISPQRASNDSAEGPEDPPPRCAVAIAEPACGVSDQADHHPGAAVVEGMGEVDLGPPPLPGHGARAPMSAERARRRPSDGPPSSGRAGAPAGSARSSGCRRRSSPVASSTVTSTPSRARATAHASPLGPEPTTTASLIRASLLPPVPARAPRAAPLVTSTGKSQEPSSHGLRAHISATSTQPSSTRPRGGVVDPVALPLHQRRLGLQRDHPDPRPRRSRTAPVPPRGAGGRGGVSSPEVPAVDDAADQLAPRARGRPRRRPPRAAAARTGRARGSAWRGTRSPLLSSSSAISRS